LDCKMNSATLCTSPTNTTPNTTCDLYAHRDIASILIPLHYSIVFLVGLFGNSLAFVVILQNRQKVNSCTMYSTNLVISDIIFTTALPLRIVYYALKFHWPFGEALCRITALVFYINTYAGVNFMTCLSIDRYFAVVHPFQYTKIRKPKNVKYICCFIWFIVFCQTLPLLASSLSQEIENGVITCMEYPTFEETNPHLPQLLLGACFIGYVIPIGIIFICYSQVSLKLYQIAKRNPLTEKSGRNQKAINVIILVIIVFVVCFTPYHVNIMQHMIKKLQYCPSCTQQQAFQASLHATVCLMNFNCCIDPFIYFFACKGYKRKVMKLLRRQVSISLSSAVKTGPDESLHDMLETKQVTSNQSTTTN
uniref:G protein-coupled receptor 183 n=1 Tax=Latimeria chalumnae TaxID=7897 RepID=H2ZX53_LATCH